jgi:proteasome lid subunit RPN8/RPN11
MERGIETATGRWQAPECPFEIEYSTRVLDDIRLAVLDAFFSVPRGGAEIGGILLGQRDGRRISITGHEALYCEHATGPSFTLSPRDQMRLLELTAKARQNPDLQLVGWYHSHTRSEIMFSAPDQDIHKRFFPEAWQIALVIKPHTFEPTRAGFFFRDATGSMRGTASYREFVLEPLPAPPPPAASDAADDADLPLPVAREIAVENAVPAPDAHPAAPSLEAPDAPPIPPARKRSTTAVKAAAWVTAGLALGGLGYQTHRFWLPQVIAKASAVMPKEQEAYLSLGVADDNGQMTIHWDRHAPAVRNAVEATLEITDGSAAARPVSLDLAHLASGTFSYAREAERVDVALTAREPNGQVVREQASFLGKLPAQKAAASDPKVQEARDAEAVRADKLQKDLDSQAAKMRKMEKDLKDMRVQLQEEEMRRLNQLADPARRK